MRATFGAFVDQAASGLSEAACVRDLPSSTVIASAIQLRRLTTAISRFVADPQTFPAPSEATTAGVRLYQAAGSLRRAAEAGAGLPGPGAALPLPERIGSAASALMAGLDLLATHFTLGPDGDTLPGSPWAAALASPPVRNALLAELADLAELAAAACRALAHVPAPALPSASRDALLAAGGHLASIPVLVQAGHDPPRFHLAHRQLLRAAPAAFMPPRQAAARPEGLVSLREAAGLSADRIRSLIWRPVSGEIWPPPPTLTACRWSAYAAAIAGHISEQILAGLAERSRQHMPGATAGALSHAAVAMGTSWNTWRHVASTSATLSDTVAWNLPSPVRDDLTDLVVRLGRIAHANPGWTPAAAQRAPLKSPASLAPGPDEFREVLTAVHQAADALAQLATADLTAVQAAVGRGRILQDKAAACGQIAMPGNVSDLLRLYEFARDAANRAAEAIDLPAIAANAPSSYLAVMRSAPAPGQGPASEHAPDPGTPRSQLLAAADEVSQHQTAALWRASFPRHAGPGPALTRERRPVSPPAQARRPRAIP